MPIDITFKEWILIKESKSTLPKGFTGNIETLTLKNNYFRHVLYTAKHSQLVVMSLLPNQDIGAETHSVDQFFRVEKGSGVVMINGKETLLPTGGSCIIPARSHHNIINVGKIPLKLYSIYSPPHHKDGTIHKTKNDAELSKEKYSGKPTENS